MTCERCKRNVPERHLEHHFGLKTTYDELPEMLVVHLKSSETRGKTPHEMIWNKKQGDDDVPSTETHKTDHEERSASHSAAIDLIKLNCADSFTWEGREYDPVVLFVENRSRTTSGVQLRYMVLTKYGTQWYVVDNEIVCKVEYVVKGAVIMV